MRRPTIYIILLLCLTFDVFANVYGGEFAYDDYYLITDNPGVHSLSNFADFFTDTSRISNTEIQFYLYRPLSPISFALSYVAFGLNPVPYHAINILLHAINVVLVFLLLRRAMGDDTKAALAAAIFAVHPAQAEAVSWISARGGPQHLLFMLLAMLSYLKWDEEKQRHWLYAASMILYILSMLTRESGIVLPILILAWCALVPRADRPGDRSSFRQSLVRLAPFFAVACGYILWHIHVLGKVGQLPPHGGSLFTHGLVAIRTTAEYIRMAFAPIALTIKHIPPPLKELYGPSTGVALCAIILAIYFPLRLRRRSWLYPLGMAWFFITLFPVMNILPIQTYVNERLLYAPIIGFAIFATQGAFDLGAIFRRRRIAIALLLCLVALYSIRTVIRNRDWAGPIPLWESVARENPASNEAMYNLGAEYFKLGNVDEAVRYYLEGMRGNNKAGMFSMVNLSLILRDRGQIKEATFINNEAIKLYPEGAGAYINQAWILMLNSGYLARAESLLLRALELEPESYHVHDALAYLYDMTGRPESAEEHRKKASQLNPMFGITGAE